MQYRWNTIGTLFQSNDSITSFDELQYFTGLSNVNNTFYRCHYLVSAIVPSQITSMSGTFREASGLKNVTLPTNLKIINDNSFNQAAIESLILPSALTTIGTNAFYHSSLKEIDIPATITSIGIGAFQNSPNLLTVTVRKTTPPTLSNSNAFGGCNKLTAIYVPAEAVNAYKTAQNWSTHASKIQAIP